MDHTQYGEFSIFVERARPSPGGTVVEVGLFGKEHSNSYDLVSQFRWRGILIEANPGVYETIEREFAGLNYVLQRCAISDVEGTATLHLGAHPGISSLIQSNTLSWGPISSSIQVYTRKLGDVLAENHVPYDFELLSLDIEGKDIPVLNDLIANSSYRPHWIFIEASHGFKTKSLSELDLDREIQGRYEIAGQTFANLLLKRKD